MEAQREQRREARVFGFGGVGVLGFTREFWAQNLQKWTEKISSLDSKI